MSVLDPDGREPSYPDQDPRPSLGLRAVINVAGKMTTLGAAIVTPEAVAAASAMMSQSVQMDDLQRAANVAIVQATGAEAGFITSSSAACISLCVAGAMTGLDLAAVECLPDVTGLRHEVVLQTGHLVHYGAPIHQAVRLTGATLVPFGQATFARSYQMRHALSAQSAAAMYVVSHQAVQHGLLGLEEFVDVAHAGNLPVIVDAAAEADLRIFIRLGADLVVYSGHKHFGAPTSGIVAGKKDLVRAAYLQNQGIGRGMKVGKEGVAGAIAALAAFRARDHDLVRRQEARYLIAWQQALADRAGVTATIVPNETNLVLDRLKVSIDIAQARISAWDLADALARGPRPIIVRDHEVEHGFFLLDPSNLRPDEVKIVADRLREELENARTFSAPLLSSLAERRERREYSLLRWPD